MRINSYKQLTCRYLQEGEVIAKYNEVKVCEGE